MKVVYCAIASQRSSTKVKGKNKLYNKYQRIMSYLFKN